MPRKKAQPRSTGGLTFVVSTDLEKPSADTRKFIRSHVMVGKNAGRSLPSRRKKQISHQQARTSSEDLNEAVVRTRYDGSVALSYAAPRFGTLLSTIGLADPNVEPGKLKSVIQFSAIAKKLLFALEPCIFFERRAEEWIGPLSTDPAYMHCLIFTSQYFFDALSTGQTGNDVSVNHSTMPHFVKGLRMLRDRLGNEDDEMKLSNSTAAAVMGLSAHAIVTKDYDLAQKHIKGLYLIVKMRGGSDTFRGSEKLLVEILRSDLGLALSKGSRSIFLPILAAGESLMQFPNLQSLLSPHGLPVAHVAPPFLGDMDGKLIQVWMMLDNFCTLINFAAETQQKITTNTFLNAMTSVMYQLLRLKYSDNAQNEIIRLGLLAFSSSIFLQWRSIGMTYPYLTKRFKTRLLTVSEMGISPKLSLWLMMIGAIGIFDVKDDWWLRSLFLIDKVKCGIQIWEDMKMAMSGFLWIPFVHDRSGQVAFDRLVTTGEKIETNLVLM